GVEYGGCASTNPRLLQPATALLSEVVLIFSASGVNLVVHPRETTASDRARTARTARFISKAPFSSCRAWEFDHCRTRKARTDRARTRAESWEYHCLVARAASR